MFCDTFGNRIVSGFIDTEWFFAEKMFSGFDGGAVKFTVHVVRYGNINGLDIRIGQKLLRLTHKGKTHFAAVLTSGRIKLKSNGKIFDSPSGAAKEIVKFQTNGWHWWQYRNRQGKWVPIDELRK